MPNDPTAPILDRNGSVNHEAMKARDEARERAEYRELFARLARLEREVRHLTAMVERGRLMP